MDGIVGERKRFSSNILPLATHVSHLRHLSKPKTAEKILRDRFQFPASIAKKISKTLGAHIAQGLAFHEQSIDSDPRVRPVLQYYAYLNLSVATILAYRPSNYQNTYRRHGISDRTSNLDRLTLASPVAKLQTGALTLFHRILSDAELPDKDIRLKDLLISIPMVQVELDEALKLTTQRIHVEPRLRQDNGTWSSEVTFTYGQLRNISAAQKRSLKKRMESMMPLLRSAYRYNGTSPHKIVYRSKQAWSKSQSRAALQTHRLNCLKFINFGGHFYIPMSDEVLYRWYVRPRIRAFPAMTASLIFSFVLGSISRYRPSLRAELADSDLNLLADVFISESAGDLIPAFRNLLYREEMSIDHKGCA